MYTRLVSLVSLVSLVPVSRYLKLHDESYMPYDCTDAAEEWHRICNPDFDPKVSLTFKEGGGGRREAARGENIYDSFTLNLHNYGSAE